MGGPIQRDKIVFLCRLRRLPARPRSDSYRLCTQRLPFGRKCWRSRRRLLLSSTPIPQGRTLPAIRTFPNSWGKASQVGQENSGMFRLDHRFSDATSLFVRANIDKADYVLPYSPSSGQYLNEQEELTSYPVNSVIALIARLFSDPDQRSQVWLQPRHDRHHLPQSDRIALRDFSSGPHFLEQRSRQHRRGQYVLLESTI